MKIMLWFGGEGIYLFKQYNKTHFSIQKRMNIHLFSYFYAIKQKEL